MATDRIRLRNGEAARLDDIPRLPIAELRRGVIESVNEGERIASLFAYQRSDGLELVAVLANDATGRLGIFRAGLPDLYESITSECPQAQAFEREIAEQFGVRPSGHPWLKPVRYHDSWRPGHSVFDEGTVPAETKLFRVEGDEIHEVAVGPVHAGVIEPGHFRFQCHGETVFHLEIALGYQHRGIERSLIGGPSKRSFHYLETVAGDTTIGHSVAFAQAMESLAGVRAPVRADSLRGIALELERLANHTGDLGALSGDVAFLPTASFCGRIRGDFLNLTAELCGSRFGRGMVVPGGVRFDLAKEQMEGFASRLAAATRDVVEAGKLLWNAPTVIERFENTGEVAAEECDAMGLVGVAARACGRSIDVRHDFPSGIYRFAHVPVMTAHVGDVNARAFVRFMEIQRSSAFIARQLDALPSTPLRTTVGALRPEMIVVSMTEGWRGEICHVAITDQNGTFARYKITDPSFHNWFGLALALREGQISDFPLCNKSFNLSYCGHDL
ncbi:MAG: NADH-quinone oxidoreductase subunit C [Thermoanaerobaculia bacterium]